jgi:hypothetical protein
MGKLKGRKEKKRIRRSRKLDAAGGKETKCLVWRKCGVALTRSGLPHKPWTPLELLLTSSLWSTHHCIPSHPIPPLTTPGDFLIRLTLRPPLLPST